MEPEKKPEIDIDANFMKDVIADIGIDIDQSQLDEIVNEAKKDNQNEKKDADKKDGNDKK